MVALLVAAYPKVELQQASVNLYAERLEPLPLALGKAAIDAATVRHTWFPSLAELLACVAEIAVGTPDTYTAWEAVSRYCSAVAHPTYEPCVCDDGWADDEREVPCPLCRGEAKVRVPAPALHPLAKRALEHVGGPRGVLDANEPGIVRAQWERAYKELTAMAHRQVAAGGNWAQLAQGDERWQLTSG